MSQHTFNIKHLTCIAAARSSHPSKNRKCMCNKLLLTSQDKGICVTNCYLKPLTFHIDVSQTRVPSRTSPTVAGAPQQGRDDVFQECAGQPAVVGHRVNQLQSMISHLWTSLHTETRLAANLRLGNN